MRVPLDKIGNYTTVHYRHHHNLLAQLVYQILLYSASCAVVNGRTHSLTGPLDRREERRLSSPIGSSRGKPVQLGNSSRIPRVSHTPIPRKFRGNVFRWNRPSGQSCKGRCAVQTWRSLAMSQATSAVSPTSTSSWPIIPHTSRTTSRTLPVRPVIGSLTCTGVDCQMKCFMPTNRFLQTTYMSKYRSICS